MPWLSLLTGLVSLVAELAKFLGNKRLIDAGAAEAVAKGQADVLENLRRIQVARDALVDPESGRAERLRDRFQRPD
jgi:hypothetical protein